MDTAVGPLVTEAKGTPVTGRSSPQSDHTRLWESETSRPGSNSPTENAQQCNAKVHPRLQKEETNYASQVTPWFTLSKPSMQKKKIYAEWPSAIKITKQLILNRN